MFNIVIQSQNSETVIHNVHTEDLQFWHALLEDSVQQGRVLNVQFIEVKQQPHQAA